MPSIANLAVSITARLGAFEKGMRRAGRLVGKFGGSVARTGAQVAGFGIGAGVVAATGIGALVRSQMQAIDQTAKLADRLNVGTENLIAFTHAADLAGSSPEELSNGIEKLTKTIGETATGATTRAVPAFRALGFSAQQLAAMAPDEAFLRISQSIAGISNAAVRAAITTQLFGRSGQGLINTLQEIGTNFVGARKETEEFGLSFSRIDAEKVVVANDQITRMLRLLTGVGTQLAVNVAPLVAAVTTRVIEFGKAGLQSGNLVARAFSSAVNFMAQLADGIELLKGSFFALKGTVEAIVAGVLRALEGLRLAVGDLVEFVSFGKIKFADPEDSPLREQIDGFATAAQDSFEKAATALTAFGTGKHAAAAKQFLADVNEQAEEFARTAVKARDVAGRPLPLPDLSARKQRASEFRQIDLSRTFVGGVAATGRAQPVRVAQLDTTNSLLQTIARRVGTQAAVAV